MPGGKCLSPTQMSSKLMNENIQIKSLSVDLGSSLMTLSEEQG